MADGDARFATIVAMVVTGVCVSQFSACTGISIGPVTLVPHLPPTGTLLYADSDVTVERPDHGKLPSTSGMQLLPGDTIDTAGGQAVIDYEDGSTVMLNHATRVTLGSITLLFGELFAKIKTTAKDGGAEVVTKELSVSVEATQYGVRRTNSNSPSTPSDVSVYVRQGHLRCAPGAGAKWQSVTLTENFSLVVNGYRVPSAPWPVDAMALSRWADEAEQRLRKPRLPSVNLAF